MDQMILKKAVAVAGILTAIFILSATLNYRYLKAEAGEDICVKVNDSPPLYQCKFKDRGCLVFYAKNGTGGGVHCLPNSELNKK